MYARESLASTADDARAVEIIAALPTVARARERRKSPIRARRYPAAS
jgi:hypothetical protein